MRRITKFGVLPIFRGLGGKLTPLRVLDAPSAKEARRKADMLASVVGGAVMFSRSGDPVLQQWDETVILGYSGDVPEGIKATSRSIEQA